MYYLSYLDRGRPGAGIFLSDRVLRYAKCGNQKGPGVPGPGDVVYYTCPICGNDYAGKEGDGAQPYACCPECAKKSADVAYLKAVPEWVIRAWLNMMSQTYDPLDVVRHKAARVTKKWLDPILFCDYLVHMKKLTAAKKKSLVELGTVYFVLEHGNTWNPRGVGLRDTEPKKKPYIKL